MKKHITKLFLAFYVPYLVVASILMALALKLTLVETVLVFFLGFPETCAGNAGPTLVGYVIAMILNRKQTDAEIKLRSWVALMSVAAIVEFAGSIFQLIRGNTWNIAFSFAGIFLFEIFRAKRKLKKVNTQKTVSNNSAHREENVVDMVDRAWKNTGSKDLFKAYLRHRDLVCDLARNNEGVRDGYYYLFAYSYYLTFKCDKDKRLSKYSADAVIRAILQALRNACIIDGTGKIQTRKMLKKYNSIYKNVLKVLKGRY